MRIIIGSTFTGVFAEFEDPSGLIKRSPRTPWGTRFYLCIFDHSQRDTKYEAESLENFALQLASDLSRRKVEIVEGGKSNVLDVPKSNVIKGLTSSGLKRCARCYRSKGTDQFHRDSASPDGRKRYCKACTNEDRRHYYRKQREAIS